MPGPNPSGGRLVSECAFADAAGAGVRVVHAALLAKGPHAETQLPCWQQQLRAKSSGRLSSGDCAAFSSASTGTGLHTTPLSSCVGTTATAMLSSGEALTATTSTYPAGARLSSCATGMGSGSSPTTSGQGASATELAQSQAACLKALPSRNSGSYMPPNGLGSYAAVSNSPMGLSQPVRQPPMREAAPADAPRQRTTACWQPSNNGQDNKAAGRDQEQGAQASPELDALHQLALAAEGLQADEQQYNSSKDSSASLPKRAGPTAGPTAAAQTPQLTQRTASLQALLHDQTRSDTQAPASVSGVKRAHDSQHGSSHMHPSHAGISGLPKHTVLATPTPSADNTGRPAKAAKVAEGITTKARGGSPAPSAVAKAQPQPQLARLQTQDMNASLHGSPGTLIGSSTVLLPKHEPGPGGVLGPMSLSAAPPPPPAAAAPHAPRSLSAPLHLGSASAGSGRMVPPAAAALGTGGEVTPGATVRHELAVLQNWYTSYRDHQLAQAKALISQLKQQATAQGGDAGSSSGDLNLAAVNSALEKALQIIQVSSQSPSAVGAPTATPVVGHQQRPLTAAKPALNNQQQQQHQPLQQSVQISAPAMQQQVNTGVQGCIGDSSHLGRAPSQAAAVPLHAITYGDAPAGDAPHTLPGALGATPPGRTASAPLNVGGLLVNSSNTLVLPALLQDPAVPLATSSMGTTAAQILPAGFSLVQVAGHPLHAVLQQAKF